MIDLAAQFVQFLTANRLHGNLGLLSQGKDFADDPGGLDSMGQQKPEGLPPPGPQDLAYGLPTVDQIAHLFVTATASEFPRDRPPE
jgi:hypothetical protein